MKNGSKKIKAIATKEEETAMLHNCKKMTIMTITVKGGFGTHGTMLEDWIFHTLPRIIVIEEGTTKFLKYGQMTQEHMDCISFGKGVFFQYGNIEITIHEQGRQD